MSSKEPSALKTQAFQWPGTFQGGETLYLLLAPAVLALQAEWGWCTEHRGVAAGCTFFGK